MATEASQPSPGLSHRLKRVLGAAALLTVILFIAFSFPTVVPDVKDIRDGYKNLIDHKPLIPSLHENSNEMSLQPINTSLDPTRVALIMETRVVPHLPSLILHFISVLPFAWTVRVVGSPATLEHIQSSMAATRFIETGKLVLTKLPSKYLIHTSELTSQTLTDITFYRDFLAPAEWLLVFQSDSMICASSQYSLDQWVDREYTYMGAPWFLGNSHGGNGGLSLRHVPKIVELLGNKSRKIGDGRWEDRWLSDELAVMPGTNMPNGEIERYFSVEGVWTEKPFGYHLRGSGEMLEHTIWGNKTRRKMIFDHCPEIKMVLNLDLK